MSQYRVLAGVFATILLVYVAGGLGLANAQDQLPAVEPSYAEVCGAYAANAYVLGDLSGDGHVNVLDVLILAKSWQKNLGNPGFNAEADFNCDGTINTADLLVLTQNWAT